MRSSAAVRFVVVAEGERVADGEGVEDGELDAVAVGTALEGPAAGMDGAELAGAPPELALHPAATGVKARASAVLDAAVRPSRISIAFVEGAPSTPEL